MDTCLRMDESLCYSHETMTALLIGYTPIQDKKIKKRKIALQRETGKGKAGEVACYSRAERGWPTKSTSGLPGSVSGRSEWPGKLWASFWGSGQVILSQAGWFPTPQTGLIQHLILQPHLPSPPVKKGRVSNHRPSPGTFWGGKAHQLMSCTMSPMSPRSPYCHWMLRAAYPGTQGTSNCRLGKQELSPSSLSKEYLLLSRTSGISYGKINADTHQSPGQSWPCWGGRGWEGDGSLCAPFSGIPLTPGKPGFLDGRCSLCILSEALSDLVSTEEIVHWKETSRFFFPSFQKMFYTGVWSDCPVSIKMMNEYDILIFNDSSLHCH